MAASTPDGCVVFTAPLAVRLQSHSERWLAEHPPVSGQFGCDEEVEPMRFAEWLSFETIARVDADGTEHGRVPEGTILNILGTKGGGPRYATTQLWIADAIATALGFQDEIMEGGPLAPFPNRYAPARVRGGADGHCGCSGSTGNASAELVAA